MLYSVDYKDENKKFVAQTEVIQDSNNPEFVTEIIVDFYFESQQNFCVDLYCAEDMECLSDLKKQEYIGSIDFILGSLCSSGNQELTREIKAESSVRKKGNLGSLKICAEEKKAESGKQMAMFYVKLCEITSKNSDDMYFITINRLKQANTF